MVRVQQLAAGVWMIPLRTPTLPPATTTNAMIVVAGERVVVIEPGTPYRDEQARVDKVLDERCGGRATDVIVTHHHGDHTGYARGLADRYGAKLWAHPNTRARVTFAVDGLLNDADVLDLGAGTVIHVLHTPGHAPGHVVLAEAHSRIAYVGDMLAAEGTILIDPDDDGDMRQYLDSLARMRSIDAERFVPSHGPVIDRPLATVERYIAHRLAREAKIVAALPLERAVEMSELLAIAYGDVSRSLWGLARKSLRAHLVKLQSEGAVRIVGSTVRLVR